MARPTFQTINPAIEIESNARKERELNGERYSMLLPFNRVTGQPTPPLFEMKDGKWPFRFLPQPEGSDHGYTAVTPYIYIDPAQVPNMSGYLPLTLAQAQRVQAISRALYSHQDFKNYMASDTQPGISIGAKYRNNYLGFLSNAPTPELYFVEVPSNGYLSKGRRPTKMQAGTLISQFVQETTSLGNLKYDGLFSIEKGRIIVLDVHGPRNRREYNPTVDEVLSLEATKYDDVLNQVQRFEDIIAYQPDSVYLRVIRAKITKEMWDYVVLKLDIKVPPEVLTMPCLPDVSAVTGRATPSSAPGAAAPAAPANPPKSVEQIRKEIEERKAQNGGH